MILQAIKHRIPASWLSLYHRCLARAAAFVYRYPSRKMIVIGVTGTKGKSTTTNILWRILTDAGYTVGLTGTMNYRIGEWSMVSNYKMTMLGRFALQHWLRRFVRASCDVAIVETTSEGIKQWRHLGIFYDIAVVTNLTPEHIEAHGGFEQYKQAKLELFRYMSGLPKKQLNGKTVPRASVVNMDADYAQEFLDIGEHTKVRVGSAQDTEVRVGAIQEGLAGTTCVLNEQTVQLPLLGAWNAMNAAVAVGAAVALDIPIAESVRSLQRIEQLPGRMELIDEGQPFSVVVDYAHEPRSLELLYQFWKEKLEPGKKMITLISSTGGGRDLARRPKNGAVAAQYCDYLFVTDEDPYDDDPQQIIDEVAAGALNAGYGKEEGKNLWRIVSRKEAIEKAFSLAQPGDVVFLTAKGAEQSMVVASGKKIPWDDRLVAREILRKTTK